MRKFAEQCSRRFLTSYHTSPTTVDCFSSCVPALWKYFGLVAFAVNFMMVKHYEVAELNLKI